MGSDKMTDPEYELSKGRIPVWLSVDDVIWLRDQLPGPDGARAPEIQSPQAQEQQHGRWQRLRARAAMALSKSGNRPAVPLPPNRMDILFEGVWGKLVPTRVNAETVGLRVVRTAYRFDFLRIEPGDVLLSGNTIPLTSWDNFGLFVQRLRAEGRVEMILTRGPRLLRIAGLADDSEPAGSSAITFTELGRSNNSFSE
jgi:hypothetical protein